MFSKFILTSFFLIGLLISVPAVASDSIEQCLAEHETCSKACLEKDTAGSQAACVAQCGLAEAQCAGNIGLKTGEPYIRDKIEELEGFMKRFLDDFLPENDTQSQPDHPNHTDT